MLESLLYYRVHELLDLVALIHVLPGIIAARRVRLVVIDSIAFPFRASNPTAAVFDASGGNGGGGAGGGAAAADRSRLVTQVARALYDVARGHDVAVVTTNHLTSRSAWQAGGQPGQRAAPPAMVPALGEAWAHAIATRVELAEAAGDAKETGERVARLTKSPVMSKAECCFRISRKGIRSSQAGL
jgi:RecA/RadA recombinase